MLEQQLERYLYSNCQLQTDPIALPTSSTANIWNQLKPAQQARQRVRRILTICGNELNDADRIRMMYGDTVSYEVAEVCDTLLNTTLPVKSNSTIPQVIEYTSKQIEQGKPIQLTVTQCISRGNACRERELQDWFGLEYDKSTAPEFLNGLQKKGWQALKKIQTNVGYPVQIQMLLGDMDYFTMDQVNKWCTPEQLQLLSVNLRSLNQQIQAEADAYFGTGIVQVNRWSNFYDLENFDEYQKQVELPIELMQKSRVPYLKSGAMLHLQINMASSQKHYKDL